MNTNELRVDIDRNDPDYVKAILTHLPTNTQAWGVARTETEAMRIAFDSLEDLLDAKDLIE